MALTLGTPDPTALATYRRHLPEREFAALSAWLTQFYQYQLRWMLDPAKRAACVKARQIGWSHTTGGNGVIWGAFHGELTTIVSKGELESKEVLDKAKRHADVLVKLGSKMAKTRRSSDLAVEFVGGGRILALPSTGGRGFSGNLILDEFAYHEHAKETLDAAMPAMRLGNFRSRVISTPNGVGNEFHQIVKGCKNGTLKKTKLYEVTIHDAMRDGFPVNLDECWEDARHDPRIFGQLYECKFLDSELQYIPGYLIDEASASDDMSSNEGAYFAGLDIGKNVDRTVLIVVRKVGGINLLQHIESVKRTDQEQLEQMVDRAFKRFGIRRLALDSTGLGAFPAERMQKKFGISKVEPINFTLQVKEDLATSLYVAFAEHKLRVPRHDIKGTADGRPLKFDNSRKLCEQLLEDVASLKRIITTAGNVRYDAPHTDEGHADSAWALALAVHAAMTAPTYARM
jgi:phage FluMu gp28-like protein